MPHDKRDARDRFFALVNLDMRAIDRRVKEAGSAYIEMQYEKAMNSGQVFDQKIIAEDAYDEVKRVFWAPVEIADASVTRDPAE